jgi:phosphoribosylformimino-5-aminoimidazole carboxamide ribotide isomerase
MIVIPAVDLRDGRCVQLVGGSYDHEMIRLDDPVAVATKWQSAGFRRLHLVDLDAATGRGSNRELIARILESSGAEVQVGGGIRRMEDVTRLTTAGAARVVVGTRALEEPEWIAELAVIHPERVIVAVDVRDGKVVTRGWSSTHDGDIDDVLGGLNDLPLAGILVTAVHLEGQMKGTDKPLMESVMKQTKLPVYASGGIGSIDDLRSLTSIGITGVIVGMALYTGAIDAAAIIEEFGE